MKKSSKDNNSPYFYKDLGILIFSLKIIFKYLFVRNAGKSEYHFITLLRNFFISYQIRNKLYLTKLIKFNNKFYSTPVIPSFPSNAFDVMVHNGGQNFLAAGTENKRQIDSAFIAITNKCNLNCNHCYEKHNINSKQGITTEKIIDTITKLQRMGTNIIILTGGEPLMEFDKIIKVLKNVDLNLSEFHIHTSGTGLTLEKAKILKEVGLSAAAVGLDSFDSVKNDNIRGSGAFDNSVNALKLFNEAEVFTYVNLCVTGSLLKSGEIWSLYNLMKDLKVSIIQVLEPRPCGGYFKEDVSKLFSNLDRLLLTDFMIKANTDKKYKNHPLIYYVAHVEGANQMGCMMGGLSHFYIDSSGNLNPCVFLPVSFGNINEEDFNSIYARMRKSVPRPIHKECPSLLLSDEIIKKSNNGTDIPVPIDLIKKEWENILN